MVLLFLAVALVACGQSDGARTDELGSDSAETPVRGVGVDIPQLVVEDLEVSLVSGDPTTLARVMVVPEGVTIEDVAASAIPRGTVLTVDASTAERYPEGIVAVDAVLSGAVDATVTLYLLEGDGEWVLVGTSEPVIAG